MRYTTSTINKRKYRYAWDKLYINRGVSIQKNKCLGREGSTINTEKKEITFAKELIGLETKERTTYWSKRVKYPKTYEYMPILKLEELRAKLYRGKIDLGKIANHALEIAFVIDFIYNSNKIEGSKIPREEVTETVKNKKNGKRKDEITSTLLALEYLDSDFKFTLHHIKELHTRLLKHEPSKKGYRTKKIIVGNSEVCSPETIKEELENLLKWYKENRYELYPIELAFLFYYRFERIHPFIDGNGRCGRLLMNKILKDAKYHPIIVWDKRRLAHFNVFEKAMDGKIKLFLRFMTEEYVKTYKEYIKKIEKAINYEELTNFFLSPTDKIN